MSVGFLYLAPYPALEPVAEVRQGRFVDIWPEPWLRVGEVDTFEIDFSLRFATMQAVLTVTLVNPHRMPQFPRSVPVSAGFQYADDSERVICTRAQQIDWCRFGMPSELLVSYSAGTRGVRRTTAAWTPASAPARDAPYSGNGVDLVPGRLRGYRGWRLASAVGERPLRLTSLTANTVWPWTPTVRASCHRAEIIASGRGSFDPLPPHDPDDVPNATCSCGFYARHRIDGIGTHPVTGVIEAWGRVEVGTLGFRAQMARLIALCMTNDWATHALSEELSALYRVQVFATPGDMLEAYPPHDVAELVGGPSVKPLPYVPCAGCLATGVHGTYGPHDSHCRAGEQPSTRTRVRWALGGTINWAPGFGPQT